MTRSASRLKVSPWFAILAYSDPESDIPFARALYSNDKFMRAFFNSLSNEGILVMQLGEAPEFGSPDETHSRYKNRAKTTTLLEDLGFERIHTYEEVSHQMSPIVMCTDPFSLCVVRPDKMLGTLRIRCAVDVRHWFQVLQHAEPMVRECSGNRPPHQ